MVWCDYTKDLALEFVVQGLGYRKGLCRMHGVKG